jgi:hypothetical protein
LIVGRDDTFKQGIRMIDSQIQTNGGSTASTERQDDDSADELGEDEVFHVLQNSRRRDALRVLCTVEGASDLRTLADRVASLENDVSVADLSEEERQSAYVSLYQTHLPKLDDVGAVQYDQEAGTIERGPTATRFDPYLEIGRTEATNDLLDRDLAGIARNVREAGGGTATLLGGVMLGASTTLPSPILLVGTVLAFTAMVSGWVVEGVTSLAA